MTYSMDFTLKIKQGIGNVAFGMTPAEVEALLGRANETERIENADEGETTVLHYPEFGLTFFFEGEAPTLSCLSVENEACTLWGEPVFDLDERALVRLMVENDFPEQDVDQEDWGERRVSFPKANIDFFFDAGDLVSVLLGA